MLPDGLHYVDSWIVDDDAFDRCFQLMETDDPSLFDRVARELARPRRLRSVPSHQLGRRRAAGWRDMDGRELSVSHLGRAVRPRSSAVRGSSSSPDPSVRLVAVGSVAGRGRGGRRVRRDRGRGGRRDSGRDRGRGRRLWVRDRSTGEQCGDDVGDERRAGPGGGEVDVHRVDVRRRVVGLPWCSPTRRPRTAAGRCTTAAARSSTSPGGRTGRFPTRACVVRNTTGRPPARRNASAQLFCKRDLSYRPASFVPNATTTTSPSAAASAHDFSNVSPDGAHVSLPGIRASYNINGR